MAFVQKANAGVWSATLVNSKSAAAFGANVTAGNLLWALISYDSTGTAPSLIQLGGQTASLFASVTDTTNAQVASIYYVLNATGGTTASGTVTFGAGTNNFIAVDVVEESGVATISATDGSGVKFVTPAAATGTTASFTPTTNGDLLALASAWAGATAIGTPTGTNVTFVTEDSVGTVDTAVADGIQTTAAATTATWTWTTNANAAIVLAAFKPASGAAADESIANRPFDTDPTPEIPEDWTPQGIPVTVRDSAWTLSPGGTLTFSGTATELRTRLQVPSGSIVFSGGANQLRTRIQIPSGQIVFSGSAALSFTPGGIVYTMSPGGFITFSGTATELRTKVLAPTGLITFSGSAPEIRTRLSIPTGQIVFNGSSPMQFIPAGTVADVPQRARTGHGL